jgi:hypothetical protein
MEPSEIRMQLTEPQWCTLSWLIEQEREMGVTGDWIPISKRCPQTTAQALERMGCTAFQRLNGNGRTIKLVRLTPVGRSLGQGGPPHGVVTRPGKYVWS